MRDLLAHEIPDIFGTLAGNTTGDDGRAAGRQLVEDADVEIAIEREREGARNGRGGHDQHVGLRLVRLLHQLEALQNAEAVLLVDDDEAEPIELDFFFDQGVGADDQLRLAAVDEAAIGALAVFVERAGEQNDAVAAGGALEQLARGEKMLRGKDLGGRHQRGLVAVFDGDEHGLQGDDGFARAHIALQQAAHGTGLAHVGDDFAEGAFLRRGGMEGQHFADGFADFVGGGERDAGALAHAAAFQLEAQFEEEQFFKDQAAMGGGAGGLQLRERCAFGGKVHFAQCGFARRADRDARASPGAGIRGPCRAWFRAD